MFWCREWQGMYNSYYSIYYKKEKVLLSKVRQGCVKIRKSMHVCENSTIPNSFWIAGEVVHFSYRLTSPCTSSSQETVITHCWQWFSLKLLTRCFFQTSFGRRTFILLFSAGTNKLSCLCQFINHTINCLLLRCSWKVDPTLKTCVLKTSLV